ncbi:nucleotide exchange factor GrpE [bacterium]|nr:nucleotide exchange factor GrpE [bacterium]
MKKKLSGGEKPDTAPHEPRVESSGETPAAHGLKTDEARDAIGGAGFSDTIRMNLTEPAGLFRKKPDRNAGEADLHDTLGELADDMVGLFKMVSSIDGRIAQLAETVSSLRTAQESLSRSVGMELERLKENLLSDRREFIGRSTFNALMPAMESLRSIHRHLEQRENAGELLKNTETLLDLLTGITQALRYAPFEVRPGDDFDPQRMECIGYGEGREGTVLRVEQSGYRAGQIIVRPCRVIVGRNRTDSEGPQNLSRQDSTSQNSQGAES